MSIPPRPIPTPDPKPPPMPPEPFPEPEPVREPDPEELPDETPVPNPDEYDEPLRRARAFPGKMDTGLPPGMAPNNRPGRVLDSVKR